jgi:hypothetical protein
MSDNALPVADQPAASEPAANEVEQAAVSAPEQTATEKPAEQAPEEAKQDEKPAKTPEQREIDRMRRKIDRLVRQREELRALTQQQPRGLAQPQQDVDNGQDASDSDTLTLSRAEAARLIELRARELAPRLTEQQAVIEHRQKVVGRLAAEWGQEKFDALASDLDDASAGFGHRQRATAGSRGHLRGGRPESTHRTPRGPRELGRSRSTVSHVCSSRRPRYRATGGQAGRRQGQGKARTEQSAGAD